MRDATGAFHHVELPRVPQGLQVVVQERRFLPGVGIHGPIPVRVVAPIRRIGEGGDQLPIGPPHHSTSDVVEMQVCQEHVGDVVLENPACAKLESKLCAPCKW